MVYTGCRQRTLQSGTRCIRGGEQVVRCTAAGFQLLRVLGPRCQCRPGRVLCLHLLTPQTEHYSQKLEG